VKQAAAAPAGAAKPAPAKAAGAAASPAKAAGAAASPVPAAVEVSPAHSHPLILHPDPYDEAAFECSLCQVLVQNQPSYHCAICSYDECKPCSRTKMVRGSGRLLTLSCVRRPAGTRCVCGLQGYSKFLVARRNCQGDTRSGLHPLSRFPAQMGRVAALDQQPHRASLNSHFRPNLPGCSPQRKLDPQGVWPRWTSCLLSVTFARSST
jgi:hypothetical protein